MQWIMSLEPERGVVKRRKAYEMVISFIIALSYNNIYESIEADHVISETVLMREP